MSGDAIGKLEARIAALTERKRRLEARTKETERKADTRRKVLAGAAVLDRAEKNAAAKNDLDTLLAAFLVRDTDRALFGLAPLPRNTGDSDGAGSGQPEATRQG